MNVIAKSPKVVIARNACVTHCTLCLGQTVLSTATALPEITATDYDLHPLYGHHIVLVALERLSQKIRDLKQNETDALLIAQHASERERTGRRCCLTVSIQECVVLETSPCSCF